jgi:hypothetical protein
MSIPSPSQLETPDQPDSELHIVVAQPLMALNVKVYVSPIVTIKKEMIIIISSKL